jgi:NADPH:quinone reductase-like Zn-dependent oxidoreductase
MLAAAVPVSGSIALNAVIDVGRVQAGQQVLVIGASGGVGSYAVQVAVGLGHRSAACSAAKFDLVRT